MEELKLKLGDLQYKSMVIAGNIKTLQEQHEKLIKQIIETANEISKAETMNNKK